MIKSYLSTHLQIQLNGKIIFSYQKVEADLINRLVKKSSKVIVTSFGSPYLIQDFPNAPVYICAYKGSRIMQEAVAKLLMGKEGSSGILPVSIPKIAKRGSGIIVEPKPWMSPEEIPKPATELIRIRSSEINADVSKIKKLLNQAVADTAFPGGVMLAAEWSNIFT